MTYAECTTPAERKAYFSSPEGQAASAKLRAEEEAKRKATNAALAAMTPARKAAIKAIVAETVNTNPTFEVAHKEFTLAKGVK